MGNSESATLKGGRFESVHPRSPHRDGATERKTTGTARTNLTATLPAPAAPMNGENMAFAQGAQLWNTKDVQTVCKLSGACAVTVRRLLMEAETACKLTTKRSRPVAADPVIIRYYMRRHTSFPASHR